MRAVAPYTDSFPSLLEYFLVDRVPLGLTVTSAKGKQKTTVAIKDHSPRKLVVQLERERLLAVGVT